LIASVLVSLPETEPSPIINIFARTSPWALGEEGLAESKKNSRRRSKLSAKKFFAVSQKKSLGEEFPRESKRTISRRRISSARVFFLLSAKKFKKNHLFTFNFFSVINMHLYKGRGCDKKLRIF
jgi:hypothetical protein